MAFNYVANYAMLKYSYMIKDIQEVQSRFESDTFGKQKALESKAQALWEAGDQKGAREQLTQYAEENTRAVLKQWWELSELLYLKYNDGYINTTESIAKPVFYPAWWLKQVGYENGPTSYEKPVKGK